MIRLYSFLVHAAIVGSAVWLAIDVKQSAFTVIAVFAALTGLAAWLARGTVLRGLRLANGALTATMASLTTIAFSLSLTLPGNDDDRGLSMMLMVLFGAAISTWVCDWKIKAADDARAQERHAELLAAVQAATSAPPPNAAPVPSRSGMDLPVVALALMLSRRKR